ncbi:Retrovirus-related Pol poly from transposon [Paramuricea clavata]|uniref:Retrovirus-related Pol poly from transposon n=1 Tax=Paramuricea clavata TaxID=317549 RepID=A0A6S7H7A1_PARCT|nr:Retrovirus-related Pol poly from transposon [Paramuricea clavata]
MVGVAATEVNASWPKEEITKAQQDDPSILLVMQKLRCTNTASKGRRGRSRAELRSRAHAAGVPSSWVENLQISPYHPQANGQIERLNRTLKEILTTYSHKDHTVWDVHLPLALFAYRNSVHSSSGVSPFRAVCGRVASTPLVVMGTQTEAKEQFISNYCDELETSLKDVQRFVKEKISEAQRKQIKGYDDRNNIDKSTPFKVGDRVWLNDTVVPKGLSRKFQLQ